MRNIIPEEVRTLLHGAENWSNSRKCGYRFVGVALMKSDCSLEVVQAECRFFGFWRILHYTQIDVDTLRHYAA